MSSSPASTAWSPSSSATWSPRRPVAADLLLGRERVAGAQVVKQADVLMLHHLLPGDVAAGSLGPNLDFYEPRTAHGSSLSPGIHAALLARAGRLEEAVAMLRLTARIDLDDLTRTTAGGLHLAAMGSVWQALVSGFRRDPPDRRRPADRSTPAGVLGRARDPRSLPRDPPPGPGGAAVGPGRGRSPGADPLPG